jgi:hypothetical protein
MSLQSNDLKDFVNEIFTIDSYKSKMGQDKEIAVLAFEVKTQEPAKDLMNFIEKGYDFVLDADVSTGENRKGKYDVFVEMERDRHLPKRIADILEEVSKLTGIENWKYRYYKNVESKPYDVSTAESEIPLNGDAYESMINEYNQVELDRFFNKGVTEQRYVKENVIEFGRHASGKVRMEVVEEGSTEELLTKYAGAVSLDETSMSEVLFLTKFMGNYNIQKIGENLFFTNGNRTKIMKRI